MHAQYMAWAGLNASDEDQFWTDSTVRQLIKNQLNALAYRHNVFNGNLYRNEPAIFAWDIYNVRMQALYSDVIALRDQAPMHGCLIRCWPTFAVGRLKHGKHCAFRVAVHGD